MNKFNLNEDHKKAEHDTIEHILTKKGNETSIIKQFNKVEQKGNRKENKSL
jgi:hypothetical protein